MNRPDPDLELIRRAVAGDGTALERLLFASYDRLHRRIERKVPAAMRAGVAPEDILQQALTEAFQRISSFVPTTPRAFYRWLVTIADHQLLDTMKAERALKRGGGYTRAGVDAAAGFNSTDDLIELLAGPTRSPSQSAARREAVAAVQIGLASLKDEYRQAIQLRYVHGLPAAEVGKIMDKTPHAVHHFCHRGLKELHAVMGRSSQYLTRR